MASFLVGWMIDSVWCGVVVPADRDARQDVDADADADANAYLPR